MNEALLIIIVALTSATLAVWSRRASLKPVNIPTRFAITFDSAGFMVSGITPYSTEKTPVPWAEVKRVSGYKVVFYCDLVIHLLIERADGSAIQLDEEMAGWENFLEGLSEFLPGFIPMPGTIGEIADAPAAGALYVRPAVQPL